MRRIEAAKQAMETIEATQDRLTKLINEAQAGLREDLALEVSQLAIALERYDVPETWRPYIAVEYFRHLLGESD